VAWQVYLLTHSPVTLGLIGLFRVIPIVALSLAGGLVSDVFNRRRLLLVTQTLLMLSSGGLALVAFAPVRSPVPIYGIIALAAAALAFNNPARQSLIPSLVPREQLANAFSLNAVAFEVATVAGPSLAGLVIAVWQVGVIYVVDAVSFLAVLAALFVIRPAELEGPVPAVSLNAALEGLRFVFRTPIIFATMSLDFVATFFGSATALLPVFARDILHSGAEGYGILYAAPSAGAILAGVAMSLVANRIDRQGRFIIVAVVAYGVFTLLFGLSRVFVLSFLALAGTGVADTVSMILRQTVRQISTPDELRGRMTSVTGVFFMGGPQLGELEAGLVARAIGSPLSVVTGGAAAIIATLFIAWRSPTLRRYRLR